MALSEAMRKRINQNIENKTGGSVNSSAGPSSTQEESTNGSTVLSRAMLDRIHKNVALKRLGREDPGVDEDFIKKFQSDFQKYIYDSQYDWKNMTYQSSRDDSYAKRRETAEMDLSDRAAAIRTYLDLNRGDLDDEAYKSLSDYMDQFDATRSGISHNFVSMKNYYSQWENEEDYNKYVAEQEEYEAKKSLDLDAADKEIAELERKREEMVKARRQPTTPYLNASSSLASTPYAAIYQSDNVQDNDIAELDKIISQKKAYRNQAKHIQEGITLSSVSGNDDFNKYTGYESTESDSIWGKLMASEDAEYEYINNQNGYREDYKQHHRSMSSDNPFSDRESNFEERGLDYMEASEIAIYNYYYNKDGKDAAQKYLASIQETLNHRKATGMYADMEGNTAMEMIFGVEAGIDQFQTGMKGLARSIVGDDSYAPASATQMASGMVREDLADDGFKLPGWLGGASLGQVGYDAITTTANMAPSIMTSMAANMLAPGSGAFVGNAMMFASSAGNAYQEALNLGYDKDQARAYSVLVGGSEAGLQYLLGGISSLGGKVSGGAIAKILNGVDNAFARTAIKLGGNMISEGIEEGLQEILTPWFQNLALHTDENINWSEVAYSTLLGALTAGFMEGGSTISGEVNNYRTGKQLQEVDISAQRLSEIGKTFASDTVAYQLAGRVNENTGAYTMGRLFNEIGATLTEQNVNDITQALVAKGMTESTARANAKAMASVVEGGNLTDTQVKIIEANDVLAEAVRTTIIDSNATWFQRTKGYNEALMALAQEKAAPNASRTEQTLPGQENADATDKVDTQKEDGSEVDTGPAKVKSISGIKDGQVTIKLEDDSEVNVKDADLDPDEGVRIETIASIDDISAADADFILNVLRTSTNASAQMDALGAKEAYKYGFYGFSQEHIAKHGVFANSLTDTQRNAIYEKGQNARQQQVDNKNATVAKKNATTEKSSATGKVHFDGNRSTLTERQSASLSTMETVAKVLGVQIYVFESKLNERGKRIGANGWYDPKDSSIHIDLHAGAKGEGTMLFTLAHELTHHIRKWSPAKFKTLADFLMQEYGKKGVNVDALVREQMEKAKRNGRTISYDTAYEEVVADSMETMLSDGAVLEKLEKLKQKDESLWQKIKDFISELAAKIRNVYEGMTPDSVEGRYVAEMVDSIEKLQELFTEGLVDASENFQSAEKNTTDDGGVKYSERYLAADTNSEILAMVNRVSKGEFKANEKVYLGTVSDTIADQINKLTGINVDGFKIAIEARQIDHILRGHGANGDSDHSMADPGDIAKMEYALSSPDDIRKAGKTQAYTYMRNGRNRTADTVLYEKEIGEKSYYVVQAVPDTKAKTLYIVTAFIGQKGYKKEAPQLINAKNLDATAKTGSANASKDIVRNNAEKVNSESVEAMDITMDNKTESIAPAVLFSERTWTESDYVQEREKAAEEISKAIGVSKKKAKAYIDSVNSIAKMIAEDRVRLDYFSSPNRSSFVSNVEYGGSFDFSTLCKKRRLLTGTFTAIQKALPNTALTANEILDIRNRMKDKGLEVSCGLCYVEGSRANMGQFAKEFLKLYKQYYPDAWQPNMADVNTPDGIEWVRINHPECYEQYEYFWNHYGTLKEGDKNLFASQQKPKLYQLHTEYKGEILQKFQDDDNVEEKNLNGGIRLQSFSDFEIVHLIDTMQIIMDMSRVGLAGQAYTKVPDFAWALGDTGLKINLSLIAKGVDENGNLLFDDVEGMPIADAMKLRERYSKNVGTILVAFNDAQLLAAMADERVDFIIPFHRSQWKKSQYEAMGLPAKTKDYTYMQNEKFIKPQYHEYRGRMVKDKATNYMPNEYWDFSKSGKENAEAYLAMCARNNKRPKFYKLLQNNGDGSYSLKADGSTDGYWKLLIDFKMYDNSGKGSPQMPVKPDFNMDEATRMLDEYSGGHSNFPVAQGIVDDFVKEYKDTHSGVKFSDRDSDGNQLSAEQQDFFKDSKVRDSKGNLIVLYHGTSAFDNITEFRTKAHNANRAVGLWLSDSHHLGALFASYMGDEYIDRNMETAKDVEIGNQKKGGVYKLYANITNPLVVDALVTTEENFGGTVFKNYKQPFYYEIPTPEEMKAAGEKAVTVSGEEIATFARAHGYDGVIIKNVKEGYGTAVTDVIAFEPNQVKYADNRTPTSSTDIRYSDRDSESVSNRSLLANAFESVAQNDIERNKIQEYKGKIDLINAEERKLSELNQKIKDLSFSKGPKDTKAIRDLQFEARQTVNRINTYDKMLLRLEASAPLQNVLTREKEMARKRAEQKGKEALAAYREKATKTQRELLDRWQDSRKRGIESRQKTAMRHKIKDVVNELNQYLLKGTKDRHVPIGLQKAVAEALNAVNMDTVGAEERIAKLNDELLRARSPEEIREISKRIDNVREMGDRMDEKLKRLKAAYDEFINSDDPLIANSHDDAVSGHMMTLIVRVGDTPLREMTLDQLQNVYDVYKIVLASIRNANKSFKDNKNREISTRANQVMAEIDDLGVKRGKRPVFMNWIEKFGWDGLKPVYAMEHIGSRGLIEAYNNVRAGEDTWAQDIVEAREFYLEKFKKYKYDSWNFEKKYKFTSTTGKDFELTLDQIMSLYAYSKRDQAEDHLRYGGIVFDPKTEVVEKTKSGIKVRYNVANATAYNISADTLTEIISILKDEQTDFVDEMQAYLSDVMGAKGNEVSLAMYDVKLFREKNYFPLKSAHQYMAKAKEQAQGDVKIKNSGFSKETKPHAKNPIVLSSFMDVWSNHVNEMSMYHAFVLPMEDFYRIYNYTTPSKNESMPTEGVNPSIENAYGIAATEYIEQMLKDLNGGARADSRTGILNKLMGLYKKGAVFASLSVVVQQPSAIARAAALVDLKYFIGPKVDSKRHKLLWDEVKRYAPVAIIKEMGYFDTNMGKSTQDFITGQEYSGIKEQAKALLADSNYRDEVLSKLPALADEVAWCGIWEAVKRETKDNNPGMDVKSEAFLQKVGERFTEVITKTQVYDSVLSRSAMMRSKDTGMKMATAFMAEPTTSINMVADALLKGKRGNRKYARTAIGAVIASQILNSILVSFVYAGRDDDEDETYWEKYIGSVTGEIIDGLNPAEYIPFIKDIVSITKGYDVERSDMAVVSDLWSAYQKLKSDDLSVYRKVEGFAGSIAQLLGLPVKNIMRDTRAFWQTIIQPVIDKANGVEREKITGAGIGYAVKSTAPKWLGGGDVSNQQQLYEAYLSGNASQIARVKGRYKDQTAINSAIRKALRENDPRIHEAAIAWNANDLDEYKRIAKEIIAEKNFVQDDVVMAIRAEANELAPDEGTTSTSKAKGLFTAEKFAEAISQGDQAMANAVKVDIIQTEQKNGKTAEEAEKSFNSSAKSALKGMYLAGEISEQKASSALKSYCGADDIGAKADVQYWEFKQKYPDVYADDSWFDSYYEDAADSGIDIGVYMTYRNKVRSITGDDKKEQRMAAIHSLPITTAQKDALYYAEGWAASKLNEAPWH